jgi:F-type H+-transporting ATPase subunit a
MAGEAETGSTPEMHIDPMEQFLIAPYRGGEIHWYSFTNQTLWLLIAIVAIFALFVLGTNKKSLIPGRIQSIAEVIYGFVRSMVVDITGEQGLKYFPYIMTIFCFVLFANVLGLLPYSFTTTSHIAVTGIMAIVIFVSVTLIGFYKHGLGFLKLFWVAAAPGFVLKIIVALIEVISYFVRPLSHSIRLMGNMLAGHALIKVFAGFAGALGVFSVVPIAGIVAVYALEMLVTVIQAYVFAILTCVYLNDALHPGH